MSVELWYVVTCDSCGVQYEVQYKAPVVSAKAAREHVARDNWTSDGEKDICDYCDDNFSIMFTAQNAVRRRKCSQES